MLADEAREWGLRFAALRYFNAAGADPQARIGEDHRPETHLVPLALAAAAGSGPALTIMGDDYPTPDGTCIRDYIHVDDLAHAHVLALGALEKAQTMVANLGLGRGFSVREVIAAIEEVTGRSVPYEIGPRRAGDPPILVSQPSESLRSLGWSPRYRDIESIIATAWRWQRRDNVGRP
jgi:UDP-glucose 4-epimerase